MKKAKLFLLLSICVQLHAAAIGNEQGVNSLTLWYQQPAKVWEEALPVGNGRLGAMVFGGVSMERIQLNEDTIWSADSDWSMPVGAYKQLPEIRQLLFDGKFAEGEALARKTFLNSPGSEVSYQTLGVYFSPKNF